MNYYLVDFENVSADGIKNIEGLNEGNILVMFYTEQHKNISLEAMEMIIRMKLEVNYQKVKVGTKNALDFQLSSYLGYLIGKSSDEDNYHIVSNDKGYDCLCDYWKTYNKNVDRIATVEQIQSIPVTKKEEKAKKSKVKTSDLATLEEINALLPEEDEPKEILEIFNQYKTKVAICNGISKKFKDSKRASVVYKKLKTLLKEKNKS